MTDLDPRIVARLSRAGLRSRSQVRAYLARFPTGGEAIGRVDLPLVQEWLDAEEPEEA